MAVGSDMHRAGLRFYNENEAAEVSFRDEFSEQVPLKRYTDVQIVRADPVNPSPYESVILGTEYGGLQVHSANLKLVGVPFANQLLHQGEVVKILLSADGQYVFSAGADGTIFVLSITEVSHDNHHQQ